MLDAIGGVKRRKGPVVQAWWKITDAMQEPYPEREPGSWWLTVPEIFHTG